MSPPGTRPHPAQSNENHWWPNPAAHLSHSSSCQCVDIPLQASMHLRPSPVDKYGSTSRPTRSSSANPCPTRRSPPVSTFLSATGSLTRLLDPFISLLCPQLLELTSSEHYPATPILEGSAAVQDNGLPPPFTQELGAVYWPVLNAVSLPHCSINNSHINSSCHRMLLSFFFSFPFYSPSNLVLIFNWCIGFSLNPRPLVGGEMPVSSAHSLYILLLFCLTLSQTVGLC